MEDRLTVGQQTLNLLIGVRVPVFQPLRGCSASGNTSALHAEIRGSIPRNSTI